MSTHIDVKEIERKSFRYTEQDGLMEIMMGLLFIGVGVAFDTTFTIFVIFIAVFLFPRFIVFLRKRLSYPRTGYAKLPQDDPKKTITNYQAFSTSTDMARSIGCRHQFHR